MQIYILPNLRITPSLSTIGLTDYAAYCGSKVFILDINRTFHVNIFFTSKTS